MKTIGLGEWKIYGNKKLLGYKVALLRSDGGANQGLDMLTCGIKDAILNKKIYFLNLQVDKAGRIVRKTINENDLRRICNSESKVVSGSWVAQEGLVKFSNEHKERAKEIINKYYEEIITKSSRDLAEGYMCDRNSLLEVVETGEIGKYRYLDTIVRDTFITLMKERLLGK